MSSPEKRIASPPNFKHLKRPDDILLANERRGRINREYSGKRIAVVLQPAHGVRYHRGRKSQIVSDSSAGRTNGTSAP